MKRTFAKLLSLFVVLTLVIAMVPAVFAVDGTVSVTAGNTTLKVGNTTTLSVTDADGNVFSYTVADLDQRHRCKRNCCAERDAQQ